MHVQQTCPECSKKHFPNLTFERCCFCDAEMPKPFVVEAVKPVPIEPGTYSKSGQKAVERYVKEKGPEFFPHGAPIPAETKPVRTLDEIALQMRAILDAQNLLYEEHKLYDKRIGEINQQLDALSLQSSYLKSELLETAAKAAGTVPERKDG